MEQVIVGGWRNLLHVTTTEYNYISGGWTWFSLPGLRATCVSTPGKLKNLRVELNDVPGTGTYTFTLHRAVGVGAWANTALTCTVAADGTSASDMVNEVAVAAGDVICLQCNPDSPDNARYARWTMMFEGDTANESLILGGTAAIKTVTMYAPLGRPGNASNDIDSRGVCPTNGTIKNLYVQLHLDPGTAPDAYKFTLRLDVGGGLGDTALTCTIVANNRTGHDTDNEIAVSAGDILTLSMEPLNAPDNTTDVAWGLLFVADTNGESLILGGSFNDLDNTATEYNLLVPDAPNTWSGDETWRYQLAQECTLKKLYMLLSGSPGVGNKYTFTVRYDGGSPVDGLVVEIAAAATTGNDTAHTITVADGKTVGLEVNPDSSPTSRDAYWGLVCFTTTAQHYDRSGTALLGLATSASRARVAIRSNTALLGLLSTATRTIALTREDTALLGLKATASRYRGYIRSGIALLGLKTTASRIKGYTRSGTALLGLKTTASRVVVLTRTKTALLGLKGTGSRVIAYTERVATALLGLKTTATRTVAYTRTGTALLGLKTTAITIFNYIALHLAKRVFTLHPRKRIFDLHLKKRDFDL